MVLGMRCLLLVSALGHLPSSLLCIKKYNILVIHKHVIVTWVSMCTTNLPQKLELTAIDTGDWEIFKLNSSCKVSWCDFVQSV